MMNLNRNLARSVLRQPTAALARRAQSTGVSFQLTEQQLEFQEVARKVRIDAVSFRKLCTQTPHYSASESWRCVAIAGGLCRLRHGAKTAENFSRGLPKVGRALIESFQQQTPQLLCNWLVVVN